MQPRDFSLYGAVDLGARQAAAQRRQQAAEAGTDGAASRARDRCPDIVSGGSEVGSERA